MEGQPNRPPPDPPPVAEIGRRRPLTPPYNEDPGVKKTRLWVELFRTVLVPIVTAAVTFLGAGLYTDAGQAKDRKQADAKIEAQRVPTNATVEEVTKLRNEMAALAKAVQKLTKTTTAQVPHKPKSPTTPDPAPVKKAQAEAVKVLQAITDRIADAPPLPLAPPANAPPPVATTGPQKPSP